MAGEELEAARRRIAAVIKDLQDANSLPLAGKLRDRLDEVKAEVEQALPLEREPGAARPVEPGRLAAGDPVLVRSLDRVATLSEVLPRGRRARIELGTLSMEVDLSELAVPPEGAAGKGRRRRGDARQGRRGTNAPPPPGPEAAVEVPFAFSTPENTLDLRGGRLAAALERAEQFLDLCVVKHVSPVVLIHGHGTGKLKAGVREWLATSPYVAGFRPGGRGEGGDGVTVVALNL